MTGEGLPWVQIVTGTFALGGSVVGALATWLTTRNKHRREWIWERRVEAYSLIVSDLTNAERLGGSVSEAYGEDPHRAHEDNEVQQRRNELWSCYNRAFATLDENYLLASKQFIVLMEKLRDSMARVDWDDLPPDRHDAAMAALKSSLPAIAAQARRDV